MWKATGKRPPKLTEHGECPEGFGPVWQAFGKLSARRQYGMGPLSISYADMDAFQRLYGITLHPWQVEAIEAVDRLWMQQQA